MEGVTIFCKSYRGDLARAAKLVESVRRFNRDSLRFLFSVPESDLMLFRSHIGTGDVEWFCDEDILASNLSISQEAYCSLPGSITQQIVKAEFWRVNPLDCYLCVDSDSIFIRDFGRSDFMSSSAVPYTVMHDGKSFREFCLANGLGSDIEVFEDMKRRMRKLFDRQGPSHNFGPFPVAWHSAVWKDLFMHYLEPKGMTILDALTLMPNEAFWYGEALLKYRSIDIVPHEPFFRAYLFLEEYEHDRKSGITQDILSRSYCGIVYQSNWYPKRLKFIKNRSYYLKKMLRRFRGKC